MCVLLQLCALTRTPRVYVHCDGEWSSLSGLLQNPRTRADTAYGGTFVPEICASKTITTGADWRVLCFPVFPSHLSIITGLAGCCTFSRRDKYTYSRNISGDRNRRCFPVRTFRRILFPTISDTIDKKKNEKPTLQHFSIVNSRLVCTRSVGI